MAAHCPNPGRLQELLIPHRGVTVYLSRAGEERFESAASARLPRKTAYTLRLVAHPVDGTLISLDTALPNALVWAALQARQLPPFAALADLRREVSLPVSALARTAAASILPASSLTVAAAGSR